MVRGLNKTYDFERFLSNNATQLCFVSLATVFRKSATSVQFDDDCCDVGL